MGASWADQKFKKIIVLKWHLLLFCASDDNFLIELRCAMKSGFYTTTSDDQVSGWTEKPEHFSKPNLYQKRSKWVFGGLLSLDPLQLSESRWNHYIWGVCSASWWDAVKTAMTAVSTGQQKAHNSSPRQCLTAHHTNNTSKHEWFRLSSFASSIIFHLTSCQPTTTSGISTTFCRENAPQSGGRKCFLRVWWILKHGFLWYRNKQTYFSLEKMSWLQWSLFWLVKMCFMCIAVVDSCWCMAKPIQYCKVINLQLK